MVLQPNEYEVYTLIPPLATKKENSILGNKFRSFGIGLILTSVIQSSSLSTSMIVPLVATGKVSIKRAFSFIIGSNLGTTLTALIAAFFQSEIALSLAFAHFIFNLFGCATFLSFPYLFNGITYLSNQLGIITLRKRSIGIVYVFLTFFILPFALIYFSQNDEFKIAETKIEAIEFQNRD